MPVRPISQQATVGRTVEGVPGRDIAPGSVISLNLNKAQVLATSCKRVAVTFANPTTRIPYDINEASLQALKVALAEGKIVIGDEPVVKEPRKGLLKPYLDAVDEATTAADLRPTLIKIVGTIRNLDGLTAYQLLARMIQHEAKQGCREDIVQELGNAMEHATGSQGVTEHRQDDEKVLIDTKAAADSGGVIHASGDEHRTPEDEEAVEELI